MTKPADTTPVAADEQRKRLLDLAHRIEHDATGDEVPEVVAREMCDYADEIRAALTAAKEPEPTPEVERLVIETAERLGSKHGAGYAERQIMSAIARAQAPLKEALWEAELTFKDIADADWRKWDAPINTAQDFVHWARSRARAVLIALSASSPSVGSKGDV